MPRQTGSLSRVDFGKTRQCVLRIEVVADRWCSARESFEYFGAIFDIHASRMLPMCYLMEFCRFFNTLQAIDFIGEP
jgi:hypothetical protein